MATTTTLPSVAALWSRAIATPQKAVSDSLVGRLWNVEYASPPVANSNPETELLFFSIEFSCGQELNLKHRGTMNVHDRSRSCGH